jgi:hypothetical protein
MRHHIQSPLGRAAFVLIAGVIPAHAQVKVENKDAVAQPIVATCDGRREEKVVPPAGSLVLPKGPCYIEVLSSESSARVANGGEVVIRRGVAERQ